MLPPSPRICRGCKGVTSGQPGFGELLHAAPQVCIYVLLEELRPEARLLVSPRQVPTETPLQDADSSSHSLTHWEP